MLERMRTHMHAVNSSASQAVQQQCSLALEDKFVYHLTLTSWSIVKELMQLMCIAQIVDGTFVLSCTTRA